MMFMDWKETVRAIYDELHFGRDSIFGGDGRNLARRLVTMIEERHPEMSEANLPPSLAVVPNIPYERQTIRELELERAYWKGKLDSATKWGASIVAAAEFMKACDVWLERKRSKDRP